MKILITGGHITPALALADKLLTKKNVEIVFVGRKYTSSEDDVSLEYKELTKRGVRFIHLHTGRLTRVASIKSFKSVMKILPGFYKSLLILRSEKPDVVLSFGGYIALPIALTASFLKIPVYTHEQTAIPGLTNKVIAKFCKKIFISFAESARYFAVKKTILTGNPVRESIFAELHKPFDIPKGKPVLYITGGSLGSHSINYHIEHILEQLLENYVVIHQTGNVSEYKDFERLQQKRQSLPTDLQKNYFLMEHTFEEDLGYILSHTDLVSSRSGANTFFELIALQKPAILIPLPWCANGEQQRHAELFAEAGVGKIFDQSDSSDSLKSLIEMMMDDIEVYKSNFHKLKSLYKTDAADQIVSEILV